MKRLYITDLDGTLLNKDGQLSKKTKGIIKALIDDGALVTVATGRSLQSLRELMEECLPTLPVIVHNGARIGSATTGEYVYNNTMQKGVLDELLALAFAHHHAPFLNAFDDNGDRFCYTLPANRPTEEYIRYRSQIMPEAMMHYKFRTDMRNVNVINMNIIDTMPRLQEFKEMVIESCAPWVDSHITTDANFPELGWLTVGDIRSHKAEAIRTLCGLISPEPLHVTVFGDQLNDIHMFEAADRAIAVENASPELLERAHQVIGPHWEDSVAQFIAREWIEIGETDK